MTPKEKSGRLPWKAPSYHDVTITLPGDVPSISEQLGSCPVCTHVTLHYNDVIVGAIESQITSLTIVYSIVYWDADQRKHQSSASLAFVPWIHRRPVNSPHKWPVTRKMFPFDDVIMDFIIFGRTAWWTKELANRFILNTHQNNTTGCICCVAWPKF